jgi:hypothetical protein
VGLKQADLDNSPDVVAVSIDPALTPWTKLQNSSEYVLRGRSGIPDRILEAVWRGIGRSVRRWRVYFAKSRIIVTRARIVLNSRTRIKRVCRTIGLTDSKEWQVNIVDFYQFPHLNQYGWVNCTIT